MSLGGTSDLVVNFGLGHKGASRMLPLSNSYGHVFRRLRSLAVAFGLLAALLVVLPGCDTMRNTIGETATDISSVKVGATREQVQASVGEPLCTSREADQSEIALYKYSKDHEGAEWWNVPLVPVVAGVEIAYYAVAGWLLVFGKEVQSTEIEDEPRCGRQGG